MLIKFKKVKLCITQNLLKTPIKNAWLEMLQVCKGQRNGYRQSGYVLACLNNYSQSETVENHFCMLHVGLMAGRHNYILVLSVGLHVQYNAHGSGVGTYLGITKIIIKFIMLGHY